MAKKAAESQQRMKRMIPKPYEASDKSYGVVCRNCIVFIKDSECSNKRVFTDELSRCSCNIL